MLSRLISDTVSSNPVKARCARYNILLQSLSVTCDRSVVFSGYSGFLNQYNRLPRHDITELLLVVALNSINLFSLLSIYGGKRCSLTFNLFLKLANNYSCFIFLYWCTTFRGVSTTTIVFRRITIYTHYNT